MDPRGDEPPGARRPAAGHRRGGARPRRASTGRPATSTAFTRPPTGSTSKGRPPITPTTPARLTGDDDLWPTLLLGNHQTSIAWHRVGARSGRVPPGRRRRPAGLRPRGTGCLRTEYGPLAYRTGDYLVIPRGTTYRFEPSAPTELLVVEAYESQFRLPDKGLLGPARAVRSRSPFARRYLGNHYCFLFLGVLRCFSSPGLPPTTLYIQMAVLALQASGLPHSEISGSMFTYNSPKHIGVRPVLHRLLVPRHPPCALSSLILLTSYFR